MKKNFMKILKISALLVLIAAMVLSVISCGKEEEVTDGAEITITVEVIKKSGESKEFEIVTTATKLDKALVDSGLVEDNYDQYGLYILEVDGEVADYSVNKAYWALSKDGEYLMTGASQTTIADGEHYEITYTIYS